MKIPLSILDLSPIDSGISSGQALQNTIKLAQLADRLGYTRYWLAEHHNTDMLASSAPEIMIAHVAQATTRIRVGSGGVMLPNHSPLKVAEMFRVLESLHPGRIDLGIGRAPGTDPRTALALRRSREALAADDFPEQLAELFAFVGERGGFPEGHPFRTVKASPDDVPLPPLWLLGSSDYSAQAAGELGIGFAFAHHIQPGFALPAINLYRARFKPSKWLEKPEVILATSVICADTEERAEELAASMRLAWARLRSGRPGPIPSPEEAKAHNYTPIEQEIIREYATRQTVGSPSAVKEKLLALQEETGADELMLMAPVYGYENRVRAYELLAQAFDLPVAEGSSASLS
ncbi:LLM class flavin-dependent oxidoreductase [Ktedonosporobacter rubrisoli]|uniref:LLM class flavin-dependent oxidoreductase n=1 Tax=Ktedonosporobacter rubrisoli TaxID=2509675 RepID=A0A4V0YYV3_KTERU|nr:LLM class flavin-dependent oxidoreductase [Ktedonosporobacter rubrisoli]QBD77521.1 LLM class flavin-dependent oxidoreductase [Ktedonosporobacter rubrisoli]